MKPQLTPEARALSAHYRNEIIAYLGDLPDELENFPENNNLAVLRVAKLLVWIGRDMDAMSGSKDFPADDYGVEAIGERLRKIALDNYEKRTLKKSPMATLRTQLEKTLVLLAEMERERI